MISNKNIIILFIMKTKAKKYEKTLKIVLTILRIHIIIENVFTEENKSNL